MYMVDRLVKSERGETDDVGKKGIGVVAGRAVYYWYGGRPARQLCVCGMLSLVLSCVASADLGHLLRRPPQKSDRTGSEVLTRQPR